MLRNAHIGSVLCMLVLSARAGAADPPASANDVVLAPPPTYKANGVTVDEKLGAVLPLDAEFRTQDGALVTLGEALSGELPTILTFNYSDCPMLCSLQLNGLSAALPGLAEMGFRSGAQYRVLSIDLEPNESLEKLSAMHAKYTDRVGTKRGWTFLAAAKPGDDTQIRRVADAVGFRYTYIAERAEWAHPAALIFLSTKGVVTRYVYGIEFPADVMRESIVKAGLAEPSTAIGFMNRCYHFDPDANNHSRSGVTALRLGALGFLALLITGLGVLRVRRNRGVE